MAPLQLAIGDEVAVSERASEWPAFVFVTSQSGEGWVPSRYLSADAGTAVVTIPYDTTELDLAPGVEVTVVELDDESGWWWCRRADGVEGWVPVKALELVD